MRSKPAYFKPVLNVREPELLPRSVDEMVAKDDPVRVVLAVVSVMDVSSLEAGHGLQGGVWYEPRMMVALLLMALWEGGRRSRRIERLCRTDVRYMLICGGLEPDHSTICRFRRSLGDLLPELLATTVSQALAAGLAGLGRACLDGTRIPGTASQWRRYLKEAESADVADGLAPKRPKRKRKAGTDPGAGR